MTPCDKGVVVAIFAEGKTHPLAIGKTSMSTSDIKTKNKGIGVENYHYLNDGLWQIKQFKWLIELNMLWYIFYMYFFLFLLKISVI